MWPLEPPRVSARQSYEACVAGTRNASRQARLLAATDSIEEAGEQFRCAAQQGSLHTLECATFALPNISAAEAVAWIYENGMLGTKNGRVIYEQLRTAPQHDRCPLCGHGVVRTLDHVLPKKSFPALCVDPLNLVPACADCNHAKGDALPTSLATTPLHPYLDRIDDDHWLDARIVDDSPLWLEFFVSPSPSWDQVLADRVQYHFGLFGLSSLFAIQANRTLSGILSLLTALRHIGGAQEVRNYLADEAATRLADRPNGWEGVTYRTLASSDKFCNGGVVP
ncbi:hypothetical protein M2167_000337 [Streptomyces sp. SPB4]|nr:hypothetical protein [Streptomyces sp. SPB4]